VLKPVEISSVTTELGIPCTEDDIIKPVPQRVQQLMEAFAEVLMGVTRDDWLPMNSIEVLGQYDNAVGNFFLLAFCWNAAL
jgi:hypothetical protein